MYSAFPDGKVHWANMGPTWVLSSPGGPHVGPMNRVIRVVSLEVWIGYEAQTVQEACSAECTDVSEWPLSIYVHIRL